MKSILANEVDSAIKVSVKVQGAIDKCQSLPKGSRHLSVDLDAQRDQVALLTRVIQEHSEVDAGSLLASELVYTAVDRYADRVSSTVAEALGKPVSINMVTLVKGWDVPVDGEDKKTSSASAKIAPSYFFGVLTLVAFAVVY